MIALNGRELLPLDQYDKIIVSYSGGKDSLACLLRLLEMGMPRDRIELWHQCVDGAPSQPGLMDWPCTEGYVRATGEALGIITRFQWKDGGFEGEMLRENSRTNGVTFEDGNGELIRLPPTSKGKLATRRKFPQVSADLSVRYCSAYLKIDVSARAINNDVRFKTAKLLFVTGERRQESSARSKYAEVERHRCDNQSRRVDQWRAVIDWSEDEVWNIIRRWRIRIHPAYEIGWGRVSCMTCIFADRDQWASVRQIAPARFQRIAGYERDFGLTIKRGASVTEQADKGMSFVQDVPASLIESALSSDFPADQFFLAEGETWELPAGAFKRCGGPS